MVVLATARHGLHAAHGEDAVIIQASHVGYQPDVQEYGEYRRLCTEDKVPGLCCGKLANAISWYQKEYEFAKSTIFLQGVNDEKFIIIDNHLLDDEVEQGLQVNLDEAIHILEEMENIEVPDLI